MTPRLFVGAFALLLLFTFATNAHAKVVSRAVEYTVGDLVCEGYLAYDDVALKKGNLPGVLVVHEWWGLNDYAKRRARDLAGLGYVAFCANIYGKDNVATTRQEAGKLAGQFRGNDRSLLRDRANAALAVLRKQQGVDTKRIAAIGYCFGGTAVLELARSGADVAGVVSFHGGLSTPDTDDAKNITAKVLVLHGAADPHVDSAECQTFRKEMTTAGVDWQMVYYSGAVHAFTNPDAGDDPSKGAAYHADADRRSWAAMRVFFGELFKQAAQ